MSRFCIVAPPHLCKTLKERGELGNSHLLLAHDVVKYPDEYRELFHPDNMGLDRHIILDNSVIETGMAVDLLMIRDAVDIVEPTCVVLPDILFDSWGTVTSCKEALQAWPRHLGDHIEYMFCPQGTNPQRFLACAEAFYDNPQITWWGVPRNLVKNIGSRQLMTQMLHAINDQRCIHLLGFSDNMLDDISCARLDIVDSIDSAVPLRLKETFHLHVNPGPRGDWWETAEYNSYVSYNLRRIRSLVGDWEALNDAA